MNEVTLASLARNFGWAMEDEDAVHSAEAALRAGGRVGFCTEYGARGDLLWGATGRVDGVEDIQGLKRESWEAAFLVTHRLVDEDLKHLGFPVAVIRPKNLALGFESEGGISPDEVERAVSQVLCRSGLASGSLAVLAGPEADAGKDALADFAGNIRLPFECIAPERLRAVSDPPNAGGVECAAEGGFRASEAAAVLASGGKSRRDSLIVPESRVGRLALAVGLIPARGA